MEIETETGKQWLRDFENSKRSMKDKILAIEAELRKKIEEEKPKGKKQ